jgi:hypothetical protein
MPERQGSTTILTHMADDVCPGCGADFSEFHDEDCPYADDDYEDDEVQP